VQVEATSALLTELDADLHVTTLAAGATLPDPLAEAPGAEDARGGFRKLALLHPGSLGRLLVVGLGDATELDAEKLRVLGAVVAKEARRYEAGRIAWGLGELGSLSAAGAAAAITEGVLMGSYRFDRYRTVDPDEPQGPELAHLALSSQDADTLAPALRIARVGAEGANRARELQNLPANVVTPTFLAERARELAVEFEAVSTEVLDREEIIACGLGGLEAGAGGPAPEPERI
jgi:leucyl aminopeptidase